MKSTPIEDDGRDDVDFEPEDEMGTAAALKQKLAKCRSEIEAVKKERQDFLDGWQRAKADLINERREHAEQGRRSAESAIVRLLDDLIPALDSFDMAMRGEAWQNVDATWRIGMASIQKQLVSALNAHAVFEFGSIGETVDPQLHEVVQEVDGDTPGTISAIIRRGWKLQGRVIRPAHVAAVRF